MLPISPRLVFRHCGGSVLYHGTEIAPQAGLAIARSLYAIRLEHREGSDAHRYLTGMIAELRAAVEAWAEWSRAQQGIAA